jgi:gamma-glutamyl phosphate reductase
MAVELLSNYGGGGIGANYRSLTRVSAESVEKQQAQVKAAVERGRELTSVEELNRPTADRLARNNATIRATIEQTRAAPELSDQVEQLRQAIAGRNARNGSQVDIFA